jgi:hypothetical protein
VGYVGWREREADARIHVIHCMMHESRARKRVARADGGPGATRASIRSCRTAGWTGVAAYRFGSVGSAAGLSRREPR